MALTVSGKASFSPEGTLVYLDVEIQPDHPVEHDRLARIAGLSMEHGRFVYSAVFDVPEDPTSVGPTGPLPSDRTYTVPDLLKDLRDLDVTPDE